MFTFTVLFLLLYLKRSDEQKTKKQQQRPNKKSLTFQFGGSCLYIHKSIQIGYLVDILITFFCAHHVFLRYRFGNNDAGSWDYFKSRGGPYILTPLSK